MKNYPCLFLAVALVAGGCQSAPNPNLATARDVTVNFQHPEKFTDVRETFGGETSQYYLDVLGKHLKEVAASRLPAGQKLTVTFTDIDLAGDFLPGRPKLEDVRIMKSIYIPRMTLTFQLRDASGAVIREGERHLSDLDYQSNFISINRDEPLSYDKLLLDHWVRDEFKP
jgi:Protein of unknown function (DUF3016)